ncbi:hypothetical protein MENTO_v1c05400 [Mesoplasma entomophilum]|uniref:Uncharacterized protein n=1 Tax=Mesoplasma entomophilum TaxID=2149 RepID=A0A3S5XZV7_9MOLU|nr:hypothetical protein [Mesoplasma entomophilum]ATQ35675.1 hypothetical protein CS528_02795 [Mesoplasma entomophilum]ATZ19644.1 hypothetical protein MENTO_v1c05400 [Mesoplasma entomophilum]
MRYNDREKARFSLNSSIAVFIVSTLLFIISCIYIGVAKPFPFWWILPCVVFIQTIVSSLYCWQAIYKIDIYGSYLNEKSMRTMFILIIFELLTLNIFAFMYGIYTYRKIYLSTRHIL